MDIGVINSTHIAAQSRQGRPEPAEQVDRQRQEIQPPQTEEIQSGNKVNPEEILEKIKEISGNGKYSVRFEKHKELEEFIVKVVDPETDELIRQIPSEEILGFKAYVRSLSGNVVDMFK